MSLMQVQLSEYTGKWQWSIPVFSVYNEIGKKLESPIFGFDSHDKWSLLLYPNGESEEKNDTISLSLNCVSKEKLCTSSVQYKCSIQTNEFKSENETGNIIEKFSNEAVEFPSFIKRSYLFSKAEELLPNDCLTIICQITKLNIINDGKIKFKIPECKRPNLFQFMIEQQAFGDTITIKIANENFQIYRGVLANQSPVFETMLKSLKSRNKRLRTEEEEEKVISKKDPEESIGQENNLELKDLSLEVGQQIIQFLHTGKIYLTSDFKDGLKELKELLTAAEKYQIERLKAQCEEAIYEMITIDNSLDIFITAETNNAQQLKNASSKFIMDHITAVIRTPSWTETEATHPLLGRLILQALTKVKEEY